MARMPIVKISPEEKERLAAIDTLTAKIRAALIKHQIEPRHARVLIHFRDLLGDQAVLVTSEVEASPLNGEAAHAS